MALDIKFEQPQPEVIRNNWACSDCKHFRHDAVVKAVAVNGQWVAAAQLIAAGHLTDGMPVRDIAACTFMPIWQSVDAEHWCSQFSARKQN